MYDTLSRNKGFDLMIPKQKEDSNKLFKHQIKFTLFNREYSLTFQVTQKE